MKKIAVFLGDPHVTLKNLKETENFFNHIKTQVDLMREKAMVNLIIMGDGQHNHAVIRMEVLNLWNKFFMSMSELLRVQVIYITGNHDISGIKNDEREQSSFSVFRNRYHNLMIINKPTIVDGMAIIPYTSDEPLFLSESASLYEEGAKKTLLCHQTFQGAEYENGMYAPGGFDFSRVRQEKIISGHIHKKQSFGNINYVGTWRWLIKSDANEDKGYHVAALDTDSGELSNFKFVPTDNVCRRMSKYEIKEGEELPDINENHKNYVTLVGSTRWINKIRKEISENAIISSQKTDKVVKRLKKKVNTITEFLDDHYTPKREVSKEEVKTYIGKL